MNPPGTCQPASPTPSRSAASNPPTFAPQGPDTPNMQTAGRPLPSPAPPLHKAPLCPPPEQTRWRLRFRKLGIMRLLGHHDLARTWERAFRRARLPLRMSQGFHPKPRLSFPAALALGVAGLDEVLEAELDSALPPHEIWQRLAAELPPGLELTAIERLPLRGRPARMLRAHYIFPLPPTRRAAAAAAAARLRDAAGPLFIQRAGRPPADLRAAIADLDVRGGVLHFCIAAGGQTPAAAGPSSPSVSSTAATVGTVGSTGTVSSSGTASATGTVSSTGTAGSTGTVSTANTAATPGTPRAHEVLAVLGLDDLLAGPAYLTRTRVELAPCERQ